MTLRRALAAAAWAALAASAAAVPAAGCAPFVDEHPDGRSATLRPHATAFERCTIDEATYGRVVADWLRARPASAPVLTSLSLGRAAALPWLSQTVAAAALAQPGWAHEVDGASPSRREALAAALWREPALRRRLAVPFAGTAWSVTGVAVEKVLFGPAADHGAAAVGSADGSVLVPWDAQVTLRLAPSREAAR